MQASLGDLATRTGKIEQTVAGLRESVDRQAQRHAFEALEDLQRKASAGALAGPGGSRGRGDVATPAAKKFETLPQQLGRRVDQLSSSDPGRRWEAVDELVRSGDKRVLPYLVPALKDADPYVRKLCAEGFGKLGDASFGLELVGCARGRSRDRANGGLPQPGQALGQELPLRSGRLREQAQEGDRKVAELGRIGEGLSAHGAEALS